MYIHYRYSSQKLLKTDSYLTYTCIEEVDKIRIKTCIELHVPSSYLPCILASLKVLVPILFWRQCHT